MTESSHALKRSVLVGFVCFLVLFAGGCPFASWWTLMLDEDDSGSDVTLRVGQKLRVYLNSNASTGFEWELANLDTSVVEHTDTVYHGCVVPMPGCPDSQTWKFTAVSPGSTVLRMIYHQPWEEGLFGKTFELTVTVTDS
ncbi:MAG: protease inhibitor I42 family protein [Phycisphaerae bacterium]